MLGSGKQIPHALTYRYNLKTLKSFRWQVELGTSTTLDSKDRNGS